ncbi:putative 18S rRNA (guanine-N(7))-methyltransferase [Orchesella cincta]|uniref:Putative 18S rRNA (Guanine-N(7))-methyltransferase n=1 Tax=Orchesella cincta TaxID=48709 RepID=A0A1D2MYI4_ORCCI|nr:putative 18S rRNA (guanine-N(7))-methyltransferase [Orchesella cincta]
MAQARVLGLTEVFSSIFQSQRKEDEVVSGSTVGSTVFFARGVDEAPVATVSYAKRQTNHQRNKNDLKTRTAPKFSREWILEKKERRARQGKDCATGYKIHARNALIDFS